GKPAAVVRGLKGATNDIHFFPGQSEFIISSTGKALYRVAIDTKENRLIATLPFELKSIDISPDGKMLAGASWSGAVVLMNLVDNHYTTLVEDSKMRMLTVKFTPDGESLAYGGEDRESRRGFVRLYHFKSKET